MSEYIEITGGAPVSGVVPISGAKNAALPMGTTASLLTAEGCVFHNTPNLEDVNLTLHLLEHFGAETEFIGSRMRIAVPNLKATEASYSLAKALRASFWVLGPLSRADARRGLRCPEAYYRCASCRYAFGRFGPDGCRY